MFLKQKEANSIVVYLASFLIISLTGIGLTYSRSYLRKTIGKRQNLLENIFNNSTEGLILLDMQSKKVIDLNNLFAEIINVHNSKNLIGTNYERLKVGTKYIFKIIDFERAVSIELADKRVLNINSKLITYGGKELILASLKSFKNREVLERSFEVDRLVKIPEESYKFLFNESSSLICLLNRDGEIVDVNKATIDLTGFSKDKLIGEKYSVLDYNTSYLNGRDQINEEAWNGQKKTIEKAIKDKEGNRIDIEVIIQKGKYFNEEDLLIATGRDISESYNYERELERKEKRFRDLFERNLAGVYRTNREGLIIECNQAFAKIFGYSDLNEIKNKKFASDFYKEINDRDSLMKELDKNNFIEGKQIKLSKRNGEELIALLNVSKINKEEGEEYFEGNLFDISELFKAQELLKESEEKYRKLVDNSSYGVIILDSTNRVLFTNEKALKILDNHGVERKNEFKIDLLFNSNNLNSYDEIYRFYIKKKKRFVEIQTTNKDGKDLYLEVNPSILNFENKDCIQLSFIDISDKKRAELESEKARTVENYNKRLQAELDEKEKAQKRLVDAQSYMAGIIESSIDMIFTTDISGNINKLNSAALNELNYIQSNVSGKPLELLFENQEKGKDIIKQLKGNKSFSGEVKMRRSDNTSFLAFSSITNLYNSEGVVLGIMGVSRDITDIKKKETEIRDQAAKLNAIIESSSHFFFTINREYLITSFNELFKEDLKKYMNYDIKENENLLKLLSLFNDGKSEETVERWNGKLKSSFAGVSNSFEIKSKDVFGKPYYREIFLDPIQSDNERVEEVSGIGHDITEKKISEEDLKSSLEEKDVLLKEVHHRVKNNMQVISSILNLQSSYVSDEKVLSILRESQNRIKSMAIIHEKLYRTKDFSNIKFSEYVENLAESLVRTYEYNEAEIEIKFDLEEVLLNLDMAIPCGLIINELISNLLKYAFKPNEKGVIEIGLSEKEGEVVLRIADNGIGIPKEIDFRKTETLGLQLVNTLTQQLEGEIELEVDNGTKFKLNFKKQI